MHFYFSNINKHAIVVIVILNVTHGKGILVTAGIVRSTSTRKKDFEKSSNLKTIYMKINEHN